ncbi:MAG: DUF3685 domain-containing protein [Cyanobacteria bacterium P01_D01_bin.105]
MRERPLQLMLVDADPVFRLGLKVWLEQQGDFKIAAEAGSAQTALETVRSRFRDYQSTLDNPARRKKDAPLAKPIDVVILDLGIGTGIGAQDSEGTPGLQLCAQLKTDFPDLPVLVLSARIEPVLQEAAERMGANGFGTRSMSGRQLAQLIRRVFAGESSVAPSSSPSQTNITSPDVSGRPETKAKANLENQSQTNRNAPRASRADGPLNNIPGPLTAMRISMRLSAHQQIDQTIAALARQRTGTWLNQVILDGKERELIAARWLVSALWRTPKFNDRARSRRDFTGSASGGSIPSKSMPSASAAWIRAAQQGGYGNSAADMTAARYLDRDSLVPAATEALARSKAATEARLQQRPGNLQTSVQNIVFEGVYAKLQRPLQNVSQTPLEIDILRPDKKLELLYLVLRQLEDLLLDLRNSGVQAGQVSMRATQVLSDLWDGVNTEFFGKYYTVLVRTPQGNIEEEVTAVIQQEKPIVEAQILDRIPMVTSLFSHWLFNEQMVIEGATYLATTPQAIARSERLLENLVIQVANAVIQPLLNRLADTEAIKKSLYTQRLMSSREIERFRNDLSWRYRLNRLVKEPRAIFESRFELFVLTPAGIDEASIYAPRRGELDRLGGVPLAVTLAIETRDAIAPRLRNVISLVGSSVVYVLTEVLGRGIGLVGRGIIKGVGSAWQDPKRKGRAQRNEVYREQPEQLYQNTYADNPYSQDFNEWE